jgi:hypothetical protein
MKSIGKQLKGYFGMPGVQYISGYITVQRGLLYWLVSLIQIGCNVPFQIGAPERRINGINRPIRIYPGLESGKQGH